jgi:hypothetical protein
MSILKKPHIPRNRVKITKIKPDDISNDRRKTSSLSKVAKWWDYLLECDDTTKTDRNAIYWKYKEFFDGVTDTSQGDFLTLPFYNLSARGQHLLTKIHQREIKK